MNQPPTFQRSSSWTLSNLKNRDTPQGDEQDDSMAVVPKTDFLRGLSGLMEPSVATFEYLPPHHHQVLPKPTKRVSIISSASETDTRSSESDDDDSWIDALCDVPVAMFDAIEPLPPFQDVLPSPTTTSNQSRKRSAEDMDIPSIVTPANNANSLRRVSMEPVGFLPPAETVCSTPLNTPTPSAPKKKAAPPAPRPSALDSAVSLENDFDSAVSPAPTFKPSRLFASKHLAVKKARITKETTSSMKKPPATTKEAPPAIKEEETNAKLGPSNEPFPNISSSGRVRKSVKVFDPQDYVIPKKSRKTNKRVKREKKDSNEAVTDKGLSDNAAPYHVLMEPYRKKQKVEESKMEESSDPLKNVRIPRKTGSLLKKLKTLKKRGSSKKAKTLKKTEAPETVTSSTAVLTTKRALKAKKKTKSLKKAVKAGRTIKCRPKKGSLPLVLTPTKVKSKNIPVPLKLSEIPELEKVKKFSDIQEVCWNRKYQEFLDFKEHYGHTAVPHYYYPNLKLSRWVKRQRYQYKLRLVKQPSTMTNHRITLLNEAGFIWDSHANVWMERYRELRDFLKKHGHTAVNQKSNSKKSNSLAAWVKHQRRQYKLLQMGVPSHMTPERVDLLDKIGFRWAIRSSTSATTTTATTKSNTTTTTTNMTTRRSVAEEEEEFKVDDLEDIQPDQVGSATVADL